MSIHSILTKCHKTLPCTPRHMFSMAKLSATITRQCYITAQHCSDFKEKNKILSIDVSKMLRIRAFCYLFVFGRRETGY